MTEGINVAGLGWQEILIIVLIILIIAGAWKLRDRA
jgi:Sec-independent protein translocase protein TatA